MSPKTLTRIWRLFLTPSWTQSPAPGGTNICPSRFLRSRTRALTLGSPARIPAVTRRGSRRSTSARTRPRRPCSCPRARWAPRTPLVITLISDTSRSMWPRSCLYPRAGRWPTPPTDRSTFSSKCYINYSWLTTFQHTVTLTDHKSVTVIYQYRLITFSLS